VKPLGLEDPIDSAVAESFCVHLRNCLDFMYPPPESKWQADDVYAPDYSRAGAVPTFEVLGEDARIWKKAVSQRILHVTTVRIDEWEGWPALSLADAAYMALSRWTRSIGEPWGPAFRSELERRGVKFGRPPPG
jgi:hypothetical protein